MNEQDAFSDLFAPEPAAPRPAAGGVPWKVLLVDDEPDIHAAIKLALQGVRVEGRDLHLLEAGSAEAAREQLRTHPDIALILLDVVMENEHAGLDFVRYIRDELNNRSVQILLVTGQPGYAPQREVVTTYEINGYRLKSELTADKIFVSVYAALRAHQALQEVAAANQALKEKSEELEGYFNHALDLFCIADTQGYFRKLNPMWERTLGYPLGELEGHRFLDFVHPDDLDSTLAAVSQLSEQRPVINFVNRYRHQDGSWRWIEWRSHPKGETILAAARDITERKRMEEELIRHRDHLEELVAQRTAELRETELRYRTVADFTYDWETWINPEGRWIYCSPGCRRITGHPPEAFLADPGLFHAIAHPEDRHLIADHLHGLTKSFERCELTLRILRPDGEMRWLEHLCQPVQDAAGNCLGRRASNRDITERKRTQEALAQAKELAEAASRAKSLFLANMSHELRTPLNAILGFTQILERDPRLLEDQRRQVETIQRSGRHLLNLINDILEISRIEAGRTNVQVFPFDLEQTLSEVEESCRGQAVAKGLALTLERRGEPPRYALGDAMRLRQVLFNLLGNAIKYTDAGSVTLHVEANTASHPGAIRFEVEDTGPGITPEEQPRIFQAFYQTSEGAARGEGAGLGLTLCREFVRLMGGELTVASLPGQGSRFGFTIPLPAAEAPTKVAPRGRVVGLLPGQPPVRILVAEDQPDNRELICRMLEEAGLEVRTVADGRRAVEEFRSWHPHFIWMDMRMPVLDGYRATREIRSLPGGGEVRIVALTGSAFREAILSAGCDDMVTKPLEEALVFAMMGQLLGLRYRYAEEAPDQPQPAATEGDLAALGEALREDLRQAAESLDLEAARALAARLEAQHPAEARTLAELLDGFRFDRIVELCCPAGDRPPQA